MVDLTKFCTPTDVTNCLAAHAARAAEFMNVLTMISILIGIVSTTALIWTVILGRRATLAAIRATDIATNALDHSRELSKIEVRPYLYVTERASKKVYDINISTEHYYAHRFEFYWTNTGKSLAQNKISRINWQRFETGTFPSDFDFPQEKCNYPGVTFFPNQTTYIFVDIPINHLEDAYRGSCEIHVWTSTDYRDQSNQDNFRTEYHAIIRPNYDPKDHCDYFYSFGEGFNGGDLLCLRKPYQ
jgi:hypothetical protein